MRREDRIIEAIKLLTGLTPSEEITTNWYCLKLGTISHLEIGYDRNRKLLPVDIMKYSASVKMVEIIGQMMQNENEFLKWINANEKWLNDISNDGIQETEIMSSQADMLQEIFSDMYSELKTLNIKPPKALNLK
jgi:hypothetical protein